MHTILKVNWNPDVLMPTMREMWPLETDGDEPELEELQEVQEAKAAMERAKEMYKNL